MRPLSARRWAFRSCCYLGTSPVEYFHCRRVRGQVGPLRGWASETFLACAMRVTGALSSAVVTTGPYLGAWPRVSPRACSKGTTAASIPICSRPFDPSSARAFANACTFHPAIRDSVSEPHQSREGSRNRSEGDGYRARSRARRGRDEPRRRIPGLSRVARALGLRGCEEWIIGRPAVHPMKNLCEYFQAADVVVQASLAEGAAFRRSRRSQPALLSLRPISAAWP